MSFRHRLLIIFLGLAAQCFGQVVKRDVLFENREHYSSQRAFNQYCTAQYMRCKENPPPPSPPPIPRLQKLFHLPAAVRLDMYPFNLCDSIILTVEDPDRRMALGEKEIQLLSHIAFNTSYITYDGELNSLTNFPDLVAYSLTFKMKDDSTVKYYQVHRSGIVKTNFSAYELSQIDLDKHKMELFVRKLDLDDDE